MMPAEMAARDGDRDELVSAAASEHDVGDVDVDGEVGDEG